MPYHSDKEAGVDGSSIKSGVKDERGFVSAMLQSAAYEGLQAPIKGVAQFVDQATGSHVEKSVSFMKAPEAAEFNSAAWYGKQFGSVAKLVPFIAAYAVTHKAFAGAGLKVEAEAVKSGFFSRNNGVHLAETAVAGFAAESVFTPLDAMSHKNGQALSNQEFITGRMKNGAVGAITFVTLTGGTLALKQAGMAIESAPALKSLLTNNAFGAAISGIPAGIVSADTHARIVEGRSATRQERLEAAYSMFLVGGSLGALSRSGSVKSEVQSEGSPATVKTSKTAELFSSINARIQDKVTAGYQRFDNFMASVNPMLQLQGEFQPAYAHSQSFGGRLGGRAMQSTLSELGRPMILENRSATVSSGMIESGVKAPRDVGASVHVDIDAVLDRNSVIDEYRLSKKLESEKSYERRPLSLSSVLQSLGLQDIAEFVNKDRVLKNQKVVRSLGRGNDSPAVLELAPSKELPHGGALKVTIPEGGWESNWGKRPGDAKIYGPVREVELNGSGFAGTANVYVQELVDVLNRYDPELMDDLSHKIDANNMDITDVGSGIEGQIGVSRKTGDIVVIDYPSMTEKGGGNETLDAIRGGRERQDEIYAAEDEAIKKGKVEDENTDYKQVIDVDAELKRQDALQGSKFTPLEKEILEQITQGFSMQEVQVMTALLSGKIDAKGNPDLKFAKPVVDALVKKARAQGVLQKPGRSSKIDIDDNDDY